MTFGTVANMKRVNSRNSLPKTAVRLRFWVFDHPLPEGKMHKLFALIFILCLLNSAPAGAQTWSEHMA